MVKHYDIHEQVDIIALSNQNNTISVTLKVLKTEWILHHRQNIVLIIKYTLYSTSYDILINKKPWKYKSVAQ